MLWRNDGLAIPNKEATLLTVTSVNDMVASVNNICRPFSRVKRLGSYDIVEKRVWTGACDLWESS